jgi:serine protease inhibitor
MLKAKKSMSTVSDEPLFIDKIIQKTIIDVKEEEFDAIIDGEFLGI